MKTFKTITVLIILTFVAASCSDDEQKVSPAKTKAAFENVNSQLASELTDLETSPGFVAMESLSNLTSTSSPFGRISSLNKESEVRSYLKTAVTSFRSIITNASSGNARVSSSEPFDYNTNKGTYTWNAANQVWVKTEGTIIKIIFPTEGALSTNNNAEFQLTAYAEIAFTDEWGYTEYSPTLVQAILKIDDTKKAEIDLNAEYSETTGEPKFIDLYAFFDPFTVELNLDDKKLTSSSVSAKLSKSSKTLVAFGVTINFVNSSKDTPNNISAYVQLLNVRFILDADKNSQNIIVKVNGDYAGKIVFVAEPDPNYPDVMINVPYIQYTDGTKDRLSDLLSQLEIDWNGLI